MFRRQPSRIIYTSDMHFDEGIILKPTFPKHIPQFGPEWMAIAKLRESFFIKHFITEYPNEVLVLVGDYYRDIHLTIEFVRRLEKMKIQGFFVIGNHEFQGTHQFTKGEMNRYCLGMTSDHQYFKFLCIGVKHYHRGFCVIGDTAWPSYMDGILYKNWNDYAERIVSSEKRVLVVTHFPMKDVTRYSDSYQLFGHLHTSSTKCGNHFSMPYLESQTFGILNLGG